MWKPYLGRVLQLLGLLIVGTALFVGVVPPGAAWQDKMTAEMFLLGGGAVVFGTGFMLQRFGGPPT